MPFMIILLLIVLLIFVGLAAMDPDCGSPPVGLGCWAVALGLLIWLVVALNTDFSEWEKKTYPILMNESIQYSIVNEKFININKETGKCATEGQVLQVSTPKSLWAGGMYWGCGDTRYDEYEIIDEEKNKTE